MTESREGQSRRLAAILAADIEGYSRLMSADEGRTVSDLKAHQAVVLPMIGEFGGRVIDTAGDGFLAEFASVLNAVECAIEIQKAMAERNAAVEPERKMRFRIGINQGDVVYDENRIYGDGINIAARLESLAKPGGLSISGKVYDEIIGRLDAHFEDAGEQQLKNIARPVRVYHVQAAETTKDARSALSLQSKPSIAVLPFQNLSGDPEQDYFADGMVEEIIVGLSRFKWLFVIARNSTFAYKLKAVDVRQIGQEIGVRYLAQGSVRRSGDRVRISAQLVDTDTGAHLWAERFDRELADIFAVQDEITRSVVVAVEPSLRSLEIARSRSKPPHDLGAYDLYLRAVAAMYTFEESGYREARSLLTTALSLDPNYADAWAALADCVGRLTVGGWLVDYDASRKIVHDAALKAIAADPENGTALAVAAWSLAVFSGHFDRAIQLAEQAMNLNPNSAEVHTNCGWAFAFSGESDRALSSLGLAERLSPLDPRAWTRSAGFAIAHYFARNFTDCVKWTQRSLDQHGSFSVALRWKAAALAQLGLIEEAKEVITELRRVQPNSSLARSRKNIFKHAWMGELYIDGLRKAGLPE